MSLDLLRTTDLQATHDLQERLLRPRRLGDNLDVRDLDAPFRQAMGAIQEIRSLAASVAGEDLRAYQTCLFYLTLEAVAAYAPGEQYTRRELGRLLHALTAAAVLSERLLQGPSGEAKGSREGLAIDEANRLVWVEGRQVELSPLEFDVLLYLRRHAGQLCTRRAVVEEALRNQYAGDLQEAGRINTLVRRLREKVEANPSRPRYIVTVRGHGYKLAIDPPDRPT